MDILSVPDFRAGARQISARALNAILEAAQGFQRQSVSGSRPTVSGDSFLIQAQAGITAGETGDVKRCFWNGAAVEEIGEAFTALNVGPSAIPAGGRALLINATGSVPAFQYAAAGAAVDESSSSSVSASSTSGSSASSVSVSASSASSVGDDPASLTNGGSNYGGDDIAYTYLNEAQNVFTVSLPGGTYLFDASAEIYGVSKWVIGIGGERAIGGLAVNTWGSFDQRTLSAMAHVMLSGTANVIVTVTMANDVGGSVKAGAGTFYRYVKLA